MKAGASLVAQLVENLPAMWETRVQSLDQEDPAEKGTATTPVCLPGEFHGQRSLVGYSPWGRKESDTTESVALSLSLTGARVSLVAQTVKNPPAMRETWVRSLSREDPLEKRKATHSSIPVLLTVTLHSPGLKGSY